MAREAKGYTEGTWKGVVNYTCNFCPYAAAGTHGLRRITTHVARHRTEDLALRFQGGQPDAGLRFASDEAAESANRQNQLVIAQLAKQDPSGKGGYTVADVEVAARAVHPVPTEEA